jgi:hypothetical protein
MLLWNEFRGVTPGGVDLDGKRLENADSKD